MLQAYNGGGVKGFRHIMGRGSNASDIIGRDQKLQAYNGDVIKGLWHTMRR